MEKQLHTYETVGGEWVGFDAFAVLDPAGYRLDPTYSWLTAMTRDDFLVEVGRLGVVADEVPEGIYVMFQVTLNWADFMSNDGFEIGQKIRLIQSIMKNAYGLVLWSWVQQDMD